MLRSPYRWISKPIQKKVGIFLFIFMVVMILIMRFFDAPLKNEISPLGIVSFELAKDLDLTVKIIESWDVVALTSVKLSVTFDFLFLVVYGVAIGFLIHVLNGKVWAKSRLYSFGVITIYLVFIASFCDIIENIALLQLLSGKLNQAWSSLAYYFAMIKFLLLFIGVANIFLNTMVLLLKPKKV